MIEKNGLRADALAFIPSFGLQQNGQASEVKTKAAKGGPQNSRGKTRRQRGNVLRQKGKSKEENEPAEENDQRKKSTRRDTTDQKQRRKTENHRSNKNKNINRCHRRQRPRANQHAVNESEQKDAIGESLLPLMEESSFPSLSLETDNPIDASSSSIWLASTHNPDIFQPQRQMDENDTVDESEMDRFSRLGLYQLSSRTSGRRKLDKPLSSLNLLDSLDNKDNNKDDNEHDYDHDGNNEVKVQESTMQNSRTTSQKDDDDQLRISARRPKWNMDRLRDRWWRTLTRRRLHRELMAELERCLKHRVVDPDGDVSESSETSTASDDTYLDLVVTTKPPHHDDTNETPNQSALHELVQRSTAESFASQFDVVRDVIDRNDEQALNELLSLHKGGQLSAHLKETKLLPTNDGSREGQNEALLEKAIHSCVEQDKPHLLRIVLKNINCFVYCRDKPSKQESKKEQITPLMVAADLGHSECLMLLLSKQERNSNTISTRDGNGDNMFHYCCSGQGDESVLRLLLKELSGGAKWKQQQLSKTILAKNNHQKTPLHIACEHGRVELIETFLYSCSTSMLSKMLSMTDDQDQTPLLAAVAANCTDIVICLIMWRGNHNLALRKTCKKLVASVTGQETELSEQHLPSCPLAWAAKNGNLEMILALLQFTDSSGSEYSVTEAISALLRSPALDDIKAEGVRVLIQAGGDPFLDIVPSSSSGVGTSETAVHVACRVGVTQVLHTLIETGKKALSTRQRLRRRDPKLGQQPESFFQAMEGTENEQMNSALTTALIECLLNGWNQQESNHDKESIFWPSAVTLYKLGAHLAEKDIYQLRASLHAKTYLMDATCTNVENRCFVTSFRHYNAESPESLVKVNDIDRSILAHNSQLLYRMAWMRDDIDLGCYCPWMSTDCSIGLTREKPLRSQDRVILVVGDNENFVVHGSVVSQKSAKLASAIRFAQMNEDADDEHRIPKVALDLDPRLCRFMLQHIYHGSICTGWSSNMDQVCRDILDLMVIAEEFLCASLIQECEMRLLSSDPTGCFCWSCSKAVRPVSVEDDQFAECMYCVEGPGLLLTESSLLDVLATTQYLEPLEPDYHINVLSSSLSSVKCMPASRAWANANKISTSVKAINTLKDVAIQTILRNFSQVIDSDSFQESVELNNAESPISDGFSHQVLLLQTCLEELFESWAQPAPFGRVKFANQTKSNALDCTTSQ
jgi:ankyrin repeat protein